MRGHGYTTYKIRKNKILSESTVQKLRRGEGISWDNITTICKLLNCQPGDIMEYVPDEKSLFPDDAPLPDEVEAIRIADMEIANGETVPHDDMAFLDETEEEVEYVNITDIDIA